MPINRNPIVEKQEGKDEPIINRKKESKVDFYVSEPKYELEDVILPDSAKKEISRIVSYLKHYDMIFKEWNLQSVIKQHNLTR